MGIGLIARILVLAAGALVAATFASRGEAGAYHVLYSFCAQTNCADGANPGAALIMDEAENLYGTTPVGGANDRGTVFELTPGGRETVLYSFCAQTSCVDGSTPLAALIVDKWGNLYGTTDVGGANDRGTVFGLTRRGTETVLYSFCAQTNCADGSGTRADLIMDKRGKLYGTTTLGGRNNVTFLEGGGTVFKLTPGGRETVLYSFCAQTNCADGALPEAAGPSLIVDKRGNLYGTTAAGGANNISFPGGVGTVFELMPSGTETLLYSFCAQTNCTDGATPTAGLIMDKAGNLYGTTFHGGGTSDDGTVFELTHRGTETVLYSFCAQTDCGDGALPQAGLIMDKAGNLYGTTVQGGANNFLGGVVFQLTP